MAELEKITQLINTRTTQWEQSILLRRKLGFSYILNAIKMPETKNLDEGLRGSINKMMDVENRLLKERDEKLVTSSVEH